MTLMLFCNSSDCLIMTAQGMFKNLPKIIYKNLVYSAEMLLAYCMRLFVKGQRCVLSEQGASHQGRS